MKGRRFHSRRSTWLHNICIERMCLTEIFRTSKRARGSSINVSHVEKGILRRDSGFPGTSLIRSNSPRFCEISTVKVFHYPGYRSYLHLLGSDLQYLSARSPTLFSICISFISRLVISSVSLHQKDSDTTDSREKISELQVEVCTYIYICIHM